MSEINSSKRISINIVSSVLQVLIVGVVYLFLYKFLLKSLGVEQLGVWSIILATTSIANLANFGITSGLVKFIAEYNAKGKQENIPKLIFTCFISIFVFFIFIIFIIFIFSKFWLSYIIEIKYLGTALEILPYSLLCLFINSIGGVFTSTLEGFQKNYIRNYILIFSTFLLLITSYFLVPIYKLKGVAFAQILQATILLLVSFMMLKKTFQFQIFNKWNWDKEIFKELLNFGLKFQIISIFQMLNEPITKGLISKFGGLAILGYYEMASRLVNQIRALIVNANQVMIPIVAHASIAGKDNLKELYKKTMSIVFFVDIILVMGLLFFTHLISKLWIGFNENTFVFSMIILSLSMFINIMNGPAYFSCVGEGKLNILLISHILLGVLNVILGFILGWLFSGKGVIISWGISLIFSSCYIIYTYQKKNQISINFLFTKYNICLFLTASILIFLSSILYNFVLSFSNNIWILSIIQIIFFISFTLVFSFKNNEILFFIKNVKK
jgi:O-antigen/teichoic acid export membrane protein